MIEVCVGDYEVTVEVETYYAIPPTGRCAQLCETPEELYGDFELEFSIKSIYENDTDTLTEGDDLEEPEGLSDSALFEAVREKIQESQSEPDEDRYEQRR